MLRLLLLKVPNSNNLTGVEFHHIVAFPIHTWRNRSLPSPKAPAIHERFRSRQPVSSLPPRWPSLVARRHLVNPSGEPWREVRIAPIYKISISAYIFLLDWYFLVIFYAKAANPSSISLSPALRLRILNGIYISYFSDYCLVKQSNRYREGSAAICDMRNDSITNRFSVKFISSSHSPSLHRQGWTFYGGKTKGKCERWTGDEERADERARPSNKLRSMVKNVFTWWKYDPSKFATSSKNPFDTTTDCAVEETGDGWAREDCRRAGKWKYLSSNFHQCSGVGKITIQPQECLEGSADTAHTPPHPPILSKLFHPHRQPISRRDDGETPREE